MREFADYDDARQMAVTALISVAEKWVSEGRDQTASVEVRNETGTLLFNISITLKGDWLN